MSLEAFNNSKQENIWLKKEKLVKLTQTQLIMKTCKKSVELKYKIEDDHIQIKSTKYNNRCIYVQKRDGDVFEVYSDGWHYKDFISLAKAVNFAEQTLINSIRCNEYVEEELEEKQNKH